MSKPVKSENPMKLAKLIVKVLVQQQARTIRKKQNPSTCSDNLLNYPSNRPSLIDFMDDEMRNVSCRCWAK